MSKECIEAPSEESLATSSTLSALPGAKECIIVGWDGDKDPKNPLNWSLPRKWAATLIISAFAFISPISSSMVSPALSAVDKELRFSSEVELVMALSIFVLGYSFGPLFLSPMSELYGRVRVTQIANILFIVFNLACGFVKTPTQLIILRFVSGLGGSATLGIGGGVLSDCWKKEERGRSVSVYSLAPALGPAIGPIAGGFIAENTTWRWVFWSTTIANVFIQILGLAFLQETYHPRLLTLKARRLRRETGNENLRAQAEIDRVPVPELLITNFTRPWRLILTQPIIQCLALYQAYNYGMLYLLISSLPLVWEGQYNERKGIASLNYISLSVGMLLGAQVCAPLNDKLYALLKRRYHNYDGCPEFRIPLMAVGAVVMPIGIFLFGWSVEKKFHWILPNIGVALYALASIVSYQCIQTYTVDAYATYAASAFAATTCLRSLAAFAFPLFAPRLFGVLGYGWGGTLLGGLAIVCGFPAPAGFWWWGGRLRERSAFAAG